MFLSGGFRFSLSLLLSCLFFFAPEYLDFCEIDLLRQFKFDLVCLVIVLGWLLRSRRRSQLVIGKRACRGVIDSSLFESSRHLWWEIVFLGKLLAVIEHFDLHGVFIFGLHLESIDVAIHLFLLSLVFLLALVNFVQFSPWFDRWLG